MFHDFPTPETIKQVANCPLGSRPGLVRGRFLSRCGKEQEEDRAALSPQGHGFRCGPASGHGGVGSGSEAESRAWLNSTLASPTRTLPSASSTGIIQAQGDDQPQPELWRAWHWWGKARKMHFSLKTCKKILTDFFSLLPQAFTALNMPHLVILRANQAIHHTVLCS